MVVFKLSKFFIKRKLEKNNESSTLSDWLLVPYFALYFLLTTINSVVWPLFITEKFCSEIFTQNTTTSCIYELQSNEIMSEIKLVLNKSITFTIIVTTISACISLVSYFVVWKPILRSCLKFSLIIPPLCILSQSILFTIALEIKDTTKVRYTMLAAILVPAFHCNFQGVLLLYYRLTENDEQTKGLRKNNYVMYNPHISVFFAAIAIAGLIIASLMELKNSMIFMIQFITSIVFFLYATIMKPYPFECNLKDELKADTDEDCERSDDEDSCYSEDEFLARNLQENSVFSRKSSILNEAPLLFSNTSYKKNVVVLILLAVFTVALVGDTTLSGSYLLLQRPFMFSITQYGYCISIQAATKVIGFLLMRYFLQLKGLSHGTLITISATNYIVYYFILSVMRSKIGVFIALISNIFGGIALPTILSFIRTNFCASPTKLILEVGVISSIITSMSFTTMQELIYLKVRSFFPGVAFTLATSVLLVGFVIAFAVYISTRVQSKRRTKEYADRLLNEYY